MPTELASTRVEVNGEAAPLIFVSPSQINFVIPSDTATGAATVVVHSTSSGALVQSSVTVQHSAPDIFSNDASGSGPGAILNGVTFQPAPFTTVTLENGGDDTRTRLAIYATGLRHAKTVTARAVDSNGNTFDLAVEFAGAAPGYAGLDQVNVVIPPDLDGAGAVNLTISTEDARSNTVTFQMATIPANLLRLSRIVLFPPTVLAGQNITAVVTLTGVAGFGGFTAGLRSDNLAAPVPSSMVTIPQGKASAVVVIATTSVVTPQRGAITAEARGVSVSADFEVDPGTIAHLSSIEVAPDSVLGGRNVSGAVILSAAAPSPSVTVALSSDSNLIRVPPTVTIPTGSTSASFTAMTSQVDSEVDATLTATLGSETATTKVALLPVVSVVLDQVVVVGGTMVNGTVVLAEPAPPGGALVLLNSTSGSAMLSTPTVTVPQGQLRTTFFINTLIVPAATTANITAQYLGRSQTVTLTVTPAPLPVLSSLTISPNQVTGGGSVTGTVILTAPAGVGGVQVSLQSDPSLLVRITPGVNLFVPQNATSANFTIMTSPVISPQLVTITATTTNGGTVTKTATLTIN